MKDGATDPGAVTPGSATSCRSRLRLAKAPHRAHGGPKPTRIGITVEDIRCKKCNKKLAEAEYRRLAIKCPRCGDMNHLKAVEPPIRAPGASKERPDDRVP